MMVAADNPSKAANVCANCKARKKRCDKALPRCRYCTDHDIPCVYHYHHHHRPHRQTSRPSTFTVGGGGGLVSLVNNPPAPVAPSFAEQDSPFQSNRNPVVGGGGFDALLRRPPSRSAPEPGTLLCDQVLGLLEATGMYLDEISVGYFQGGIHSVVPIISRRRFHTHLISFGGDDDTTRLRRRRPRAEFALLLLTMALLLVGDESVDHPAAKLADHHLWRRRRRRPLPQQIDRTKLYLAIKSLLAQAQALHAFGSSTPSTTHLIQAGVLLAVYEYASGRPEQAFVSIGNYARMAHLAQLQYPSGSSSSSLSSSSSRPHRFSSSKDEEQEQEEINIWWGILICERTFLCEMPLVMDRPPPLASVMPDPDIPLPKLVESLDSGGGDGGGGTPTVGGFLVDALASPQPVQVDSFGRAAQAAWLLDRLIQSTRLSPAGHMAGAIDVDDNDATNTKRVYLEECDKMLQSFLTILMQQTDKDDDDDDWVGHYYCVAIALTIRSLFLLHEHILDHHDHLGNKNSNNSNSNKNNNNKNSSSSSSSNNSSRSALDTVTNIVIDITASHQHLSWDQIDQLPPSCLYIVRAALDHRHHHHHHHHSQFASATLDDSQLQNSLKLFESRWGTGSTTTTTTTTLLHTPSSWSSSPDSL